MKYLGIDFGAKRVGLAISDETNSFALPFAVIENSESIVFDIQKICKNKDITTIVVGESRNYSIKENEIMKEIRPFVETLKEVTGIPVVMHPEFMTSAEAERLQGKNDMLDASAAAIILKSYLDTTKHNGK